MHVCMHTLHTKHMYIHMKRYQCQNSGGIRAVFLSFGSRSRHIWNVIIQAVYHAFGTRSMNIWNALGVP